MAFNPFIDPSRDALERFHRRASMPKTGQSRQMLSADERKQRNYDLYQLFLKAEKAEGITKTMFAGRLTRVDNYKGLSRSSVIRVLGDMEEKAKGSRN